MNIEFTVNKIVKKFSTRNPFELADNLGILVLSLQLQGVKGIYQYFQRNSIIYIDSTLSDNEKEIVCAHELGHAILHKKINSTLLNLYSFNNFTNRFEREANEFASYLIIGKYETSEINEYSLGQISEMTGIGEDAAMKFITNILHKQQQTNK